MTLLNRGAHVGKHGPNWRVVCLPFCLLLLCPGTLFGQAETGRITGTVSDATGAVLPGASLTIVAVDTNRRITLVTDDLGRYASGPLRVGQYRLEAELTGFKRVVREAISLAVQQTAVIDVRLQVGTESDEVTVTAAEPLIHSTEASQGQVIEERRVQELPLNGRDYVQLALLSEGAQDPVSGSRAGGFSVGGQRTIDNNYLLDGFDNNNNQIATDSNQGEAVKPSVDAVKEFKVQTNAYSAEFGRASGGVLNLTLKSGTNRFHGTAYEFHRNDALDARNFFDTEQPPFERNDYGFTLGGPALKDRGFFFFAFEGLHRRESRTVNNTLPTQRMRRGDFSELDGPIFDPLTFDPATGARQPFPGNVIPEDRIDPVAKQLIDLFPSPQNEGLSQNFLFNPPLDEDLYRINTREDLHVSDTDNISWMFNYQEQTLPPSTNLPPPAFGGDSRAKEVKAYNTGVTWNHIFSPTVVTSVKFGWNSNEDTLFFPDDALALGNLNERVGLTIPATDLPVQFPTFDFSGFTSLGAGNFIPFHDNGQTRQLAVDTTWITGRHDLKFGVNIQRIQNNTVNTRRQGGRFLFSGRYTNDPLTATGGNAIADFLLGSVDTREISTPTRLDGRAWLVAGYVQDDWRVSPVLTLNLGVRYELFGPFVDLHDNLANFDIDTDPQNPTLVLATDGDRSTINTDTNNWAPRIGLVYQLIPQKLVLRSGYGIFFAFPRFAPGGDSDSVVVNPPFTLQATRNSDGITPASLLRDGIPEDAVTLENAMPVALGSFERDPAFGYSQQWNLNLQYQLGRNWLLQIGYFGTRGVHLPQVFDTNYVESLGPGNIDERRRFKSVTVPTETGSEIVLAPLANVQRTEYTGSSSFHSLQTKVEHRFSQGFTLLGSWIYSRSIGDLLGDSPAGRAPGTLFQNPANLRGERGLLDSHLKHRFVMSGIWELPFGRDRRFGANINPIADVFLGGWNATGILTLTSGSPFTINVSGDPANSGQTNRPNLVGDPEAVPGGRSLDEYFNTAAFDVNDPFTFGDLGRNTMLGPGFENLDVSLMKRATVFMAYGQPVDLQFSWEFFNVLNHTNFNFPGNDLGTPTFGQLTSANPGRKMQVSVRLIF